MDFLVQRALIIAFILSASASGHDFGSYQQEFWSDSYRSHPDVSGPGMLVDNLAICQDQEFLSDLGDLLSEYKFEKAFENDQFDCSDMSSITWNILVNEGYDAKIMLGDTGKDVHAWVMVQHNDSWAAVETVHNPNSEVGRVAKPDNVWMLEFPQYYSGWMFNSSEEMKIFTDDKMTVRSDTPLSLLPVRALE